MLCVNDADLVLMTSSYEASVLAHAAACYYQRERNDKHRVLKLFLYHAFNESLHPNKRQRQCWFALASRLFVHGRVLNMTRLFDLKSYHDSLLKLDSLSC